VPYKSATTALTGLLAGEIDVVIVAHPRASYVKDGRLRALRCSTRKLMLRTVRGRAGRPRTSPDALPPRTPRAIIDAHAGRGCRWRERMPRARRDWAGAGVPASAAVGTRLALERFESSTASARSVRPDVGRGVDAATITTSISPARSP